MIAGIWVGRECCQCFKGVGSNELAFEGAKGFIKGVTSLNEVRSCSGTSNQAESLKVVGAQAQLQLQ